MLASIYWLSPDSLRISETCSEAPEAASAVLSPVPLVVSSVSGTTGNKSGEKKRLKRMRITVRLNNRKKKFKYMFKN